MRHTAKRARACRTKSFSSSSSTIRSPQEVPSPSRAMRLGRASYRCRDHRDSVGIVALPRAQVNVQPVRGSETSPRVTWYRETPCVPTDLVVPLGESPSTWGKFLSTTRALDPAERDSRGSSQSKQGSRMARTKRGSLMNATTHIAPTQSEHPKGSVAKSFSMTRAYLARTAFANASALKINGLWPAGRALGNPEPIPPALET